MEMMAAPLLLLIRPAMVPVGVTGITVVGHMRAASVSMVAAPFLLTVRPPRPPIGEASIAVVGN